MRIAFVALTFHPEPGALRGLPLAKWLKARGHEVQVLTAFPQYPLGRIYPEYQLRPWLREDVDGIPVTRVPLYPSHDDSAFRRAATYLSFAVSARLLANRFIRDVDLIYLCESQPSNLPAAKA